MKKLGIIGGMGPLATAIYMKKVIEYTKAPTDAENIQMDIINDPTIPDRTAFILGESTDSPVERIVEIRTDLEKRGCDVIAIPCNTAFAFYNEIAAGSSVPVLNPITLTCERLVEMGVKKAGVMATRGTIKMGLFKKCLGQYGIEAIIPDEKMQSVISSMIYNYVKAGKNIPSVDINWVREYMISMGAQKIILGCTELTEVAETDKNDIYVDTLDVLAEEAVKMCSIGG